MPSKRRAERVVLDCYMHNDLFPAEINCLVRSQWYIVQKKRDLFSICWEYCSKHILWEVSHLKMFTQTAQT